MAPELVVVQGLRDTRRTLARWQAHPFAVLGPWLAGAAAVTTGLLLVTWLISLKAVPDPRPMGFPGLTRPPAIHDVLRVLYRNSLVLALHAMACVAGFIAGSSLPLEAQAYSGRWRTLHDRAGSAAIAFVVAATTFSLATQAWVLGNGAATLSWQGGMSSGLLLVGLLPHAIPELMALFLPLAAWVYASRRGRWDELLAATFVTVAFAVPTLVAAAFVEVYVSPHLILALR
jgi:hypothetical protein